MDQTLALRVQEIINQSNEPITVTIAIKAALLERHGHDVNALAEVAANLASPSLRRLRKMTYELPAERQGTLFDIPEVISVRSEKGDLFIRRDEANFEHVDQWSAEACQHHGTQHLRFTRFRKGQVIPLKQLPDIGSTPWNTAKMMLPEAIEDEDTGDSPT